MWLSIMGMYEYDNTVFDGFDPPSYTDENNVVHTLNRADVINNIVLQCAELELLYPSFEMMKFAIGVWSASNSRTWDKLYKSMYENYNPIWNVDAHELETYGRGYTDELSFDSTDTGAVQGFNSNTWSDANKVTYGGKDTHSGQEDSGTEKTRTGNIGVTATQDLIKKEREIADFSIIQFITNSFKERFCLMIY